MALICVFCTKSHAQIQWDLNTYHDYPNYIDLNCSLNGESNGKEGFAFYADNRSESKISFTVNYTIIDNCGKSHSGSWSTYIIQAGQRESNFVSVYIGCPIQKGKVHSVKNITCTVSNFKDLSKNESNSTSSSTNTSYNSSVGSTESASQRQYQQQERNTETQRQSEEQSKEFVNNATELVGLVGNVFASNSADREKRQAKKAAAKAYEEEEKAKKIEASIDRKNRIAYYLNNVEDIDDYGMERLYTIYFEDYNLKESRIWLKRATTSLAKEYEETGDLTILKKLADSNLTYRGSFDDVVKWTSLATEHFDDFKYIKKLGELYYHGGFNDNIFAEPNDVTKVNPEKAIYWLTKAANKGHRYAMALLTNIYSGNENYGPFKAYKDKKLSREWSKKWNNAE